MQHENAMFFFIASVGRTVSPPREVLYLHELIALSGQPSKGRRGLPTSADGNTEPQGTHGVSPLECRGLQTDRAVGLQ